MVTGAAGFIGSHTAAALAAAGWHVRAVDALRPYYDPRIKRANLAGIADERITVIELDLAAADDPRLAGVVADASAVVHLAAQAGVRTSWDDLAGYTTDNVVATGRLLEAATRAGVERFVYASSSSVYGEADTYPVTEDAPTRPRSPYGVTKLAGEQLCSVWAAERGLPVVSLRYFTVYGPRQRPDMAFHRLIEAALAAAAGVRRPFPLYGDGSQIRQFTFVDDVVAANVAAVSAPVPPGTVINVAGGTEESLAGVIARVGELVGVEVPVERHPRPPGDVRRTGGSAERAAELLGWAPRVGLDEGLSAQIRWHRANRDLLVSPVSPGTGPTGSHAGAGSPG